MLEILNITEHLVLRLSITLEHPKICLCFEFSFKTFIFISMQIDFDKAYKN